MEVTDTLANWILQYSVLKRQPKISKGRAFIEEEDAQRLESGQAIILMLRKAEIASLSAQKEGPVIAIKVHNWNQILGALESSGFDLSPSLRGQIMSGDRSAVIEVLTKIKQRTEHRERSPGALVLDQINSQKSLADAESPLEFLVLIGCSSFGFKPTQVVGLLAQNAKLMGQILIRGVKGNFQSVIQWYRSMQYNARILGELIDQNEDSLNLVLDTLKAGLKSQHLPAVKESINTCLLYTSPSPRDS